MWQRNLEFQKSPLLTCHGITASCQLTETCNCSSHDNRVFIVYMCKTSQRNSSSWSTVSELKRIDPSPAWYCCYLVISSDTGTVFPLLSLCEGVRGGSLNPLYLLSPQRDYVKNSRNSTDPKVSRYGSCPLTFWERQTLPETRHRLTTPPWEREQNENTFKKMSLAAFQPYLWKA